MIDGLPAYMGQYSRTYRPSWWSIHSLIHRLWGRRKAFSHPFAVILKGKEFPDVSFYQGQIDWNRMRMQTDAVIIRAGQNLWVDTQFRRNWFEAKSRGMLRGTYFFYDDRIDPGRQADLWLSLIRDDPPELECLIDWENSYGGAFGGLGNVVACMQRVEQAGYQVGFYTGYYWFIAHSNPITNASQYNYLKSKPLWLGWYTTNPANVLIPQPWADLLIWQHGTPAVGADYGVQTNELDMNWFNGTVDEFYYRYGGGEPIPPPTGGTMDKYMTTSTALTSSLNIRSSGENLGTANDLGDFNILPNDIIHVIEQNAAGYVRFDQLYRNGATFNMPASPTGQYWALATGWLVDITFTPPAPVKVALTAGNLDYDITTGALTATATYADGSTLTNTYPKEK